MVLLLPNLQNVSIVRSLLVASERNLSPSRLNKKEGYLLALIKQQQQKTLQGLVCVSHLWVWLKGCCQDGFSLSFSWFHLYLRLICVHGLILLS